MGSPSDPDGFLTLSRKLFASDLWNRREPFDSRSAFVDLLRRASWSVRPVRLQGRELQLLPGELVLDAGRLASRWGWSRSKVHRFLRELRNRGTLSCRRAWPEETSSKVPPWIYTFPKYLEHQRPWGVTPERDTGRSPANTERSQDERHRNVTPATETQEIAKNESDTGKRHRKDAGSSRAEPKRVTPERDTGLTESDTGNVQQTRAQSPIGDTGTEYNLSKNTNTPQSLLLSSEPLSDGRAVFEAVADLADLADRWGAPNNGPNPHRGLNIKLLVRLLKAGTAPATAAHIIRGTRLLADSGRVPWIEPGTPFCLTAVFGETRQLAGRSLASLAEETSRTTDPGESPPPPFIYPRLR